MRLEGICVDPKLVALYQAANWAGRAELPGLHKGAALGVAAGTSMVVAIRVHGSFLDLRSRGDWWR